MIHFLSFQDVVEQTAEAVATVQEKAAEVAAAGTEVVADVTEEAPEVSGIAKFLIDNNFIIMILLMVAVLYFFMWRPESKRRKAMQDFRSGLKKGDKVITAGGIYGTVKEIKETSLLIEVDSNVTLRIDKNMVVADTSDLQKQ